MRLPATYVAEHVDLGYATTTHRAQGITVDTSHALGDPGTSREAFYVAMTRGRHSNDAYLTESAVTEDCHPSRATGTSAADTKAILGAILANSQAELSATETLARATTTDQLFPEQQDEHDVDQMMTRPDHAAAVDGPWGPVAPNTRDDQGLWDPNARSARAHTHEPAGRFIA